MPISLIILYIPMMSSWETLQTLHRMLKYTVRNKLHHDHDYITESMYM